MGPLPLASADAIEGTVLLPDGNAIPDANVSADWVGDEPPPACRLPSRGFVKADREGRFTFRALEPGRYAVSIADRWYSPERGESVLASTGTRGVRLVVERRLVVLRVQPPTPDVEPHYLIYYVRQPGGAGDATAKGDAPGFADGDGALHSGRDASFWVVDPGRLLVFARDVFSGLESDSVEVVIPETLWRVDASLVLHAVPPPGTMRVAIADGDGKPVSRFRAEVRSVGGHPLAPIEAQWDSSRHGSTRTFSPGRYAVAVQPGDLHEDDALGKPAFAPFHTVVDLTSGGEAKIEFTARPGGWLRATLKPRKGWGIVRASVWRAGSAPGDEVDAIWKRSPRSGSVGFFDSQAPVFFGSPLEPGSYVLRTGPMGDQEPATAHPFEIHAGETTDVEVTSE